MDDLRTLMISRMRVVVGDPTESSRYGRFFYIPATGDDKRSRKFNARAIEDGRTNLHTLENLSDDELLRAYDIFSRRYNTWM